MRRLRLELLESRCLLSAVAGYAEDRILVRFADAHDAAADALLGQLLIGAAADRAFDILPGLHQVRLPRGVSVEAALETFRDNPHVLYAEPDYRLHIDSLPNDPLFAQLWGMDNTGQTGGTADADIDAVEAWQVTTGSGQTVVAVIDTGVDYNHVDLAPNLWRNPAELSGQPGVDDDGNGFVDDIFGYDFVNNDGDPMDDNQHGTHVAGTIGAVGDNAIGVAGLNWNVQIMAVKAFDANGSGTVSDAVNAINYAVAQGALISNNSWGGNEPFSQAMYDAIAAARQLGHIFVAGAGNGYYGLFPLNNDVNPFYPASYDLDNIIAVAATDHNDQMASFSNYGATSVDLAAPGVDIVSTVPGDAYARASGTSMATPHVTGVVALVRDRFPDWSYDRVIARVLETVDPVAALAGKMVTGGRLNAAAAVVDDTSGPRIAALPERLFTPVDKLVLKFDKGVDPLTFTSASILSLTGPNGPVSVASITSVPGSHDRMFELGFSDALSAGAYELTVAPTITDKNGNLLNQDGDDTNGEWPDDQFAAQFEVVEAIVRLDFGKATSPVAADYARVVETDRYSATVGYGWQEATLKSYDRTSGGDLLRDFHYAPQGTFLVDVPNGQYEVVVSMGDAGALHDQMGVFLEGAQVDTITTTAGEFVTRSYLVDVNDGQLTLHLLDLGGSNANIVLNALEVIVAGPDRLGPHVVQVLPSGTVFGGTERITLTFNEALDATSFDAGDVSLIGPAGAVGPLAVRQVSAVSYEIAFALLEEPGRYQVWVGPDLRDVAGNLLDQDRDGVGGEVPADQVTASFTVETALRLDFGKATSPVAAGYRQVLETDVYAAAVGYGWQDGSMKSYDRTSGGDLLRDFHYAPRGTFLVDVPNRRYEVVVTMGDAGGLHDQMAVYLEGIHVDTITTAAGQYAAKTYAVNVNDGQLTLQLIDLGGSNANIVLNALEVVVTGPDETGPQVLEASPTGKVFAAVDHLVLRFNEAIDRYTFDAGDVSLTGPAGPITPLTITALSENVYEIGFAPRRDPGVYQLLVGPDIADLAGNTLDQNGNGTGGEIPGDQFAATFTLVDSLRLDFGKATSPVAADYARVVETDRYSATAGYGWQEATLKSYDRASGGDLLRDFHYAPQGTFLVDVPNGQYEVVLSMGDAGALHDQMGVFLEGAQVDTITTAAGQYAVQSFLVDVNDGQLTLHLLDLGGSNANIVLNALEVIVAGPDRRGPHVVQVLPSGTVFGGTERITLTFNEALDATSFDAGDVSLIGPAGAVGPLAVRQVSAVSYEIAFALLEEPGLYQVWVGPDLRDVAGNLLDQDRDGVGGEVPADQVTASITVETALRLDFGKATSPVAAGYRQVLETDVYAAAVGYGWQDGSMKSYDRTSGGDLLRDFHYAPQGTFLVDVPNRRYEVVVTMGDAGGLHDQMAVYLEGIHVDTITTAAGQFITRTYFADVDDEQLTLQLIDLGGSNANIVLNALEVKYRAGSAGWITSIAGDPGDLLRTDVALPSLPLTQVTRSSAAGPRLTTQGDRRAYLNEASSALQLFVGTPDQAVPSRRAEFNHGATETANERARQRWFAELPDELLRSLWLDEGDTDH